MLFIYSARTLCRRYQLICCARIRCILGYHACGILAISRKNIKYLYRISLEADRARQQPSICGLCQMWRINVFIYFSYVCTRHVCKTEQELEGIFWSLFANENIQNSRANSIIKSTMAEASPFTVLNYSYIIVSISRRTVAGRQARTQAAVN